MSIVFSGNNFVPKRGRNPGRRQKSSSIITANIYGGSKSRRRLAETVEFQTTRCLPYFLTMKLTDISEYAEIALNVSFDGTSNFPSCDFWNTNDSFWDTEGCFVYDITNDSVICGCTHLTTFGVSSGDILPQPNIITDIGWHQLTFGLYPFHSPLLKHIE